MTDDDNWQATTEGAGGKVRREEVGAKAIFLSSSHLSSSKGLLSISLMQGAMEKWKGARARNDLYKRGGSKVNLKEL